MKVIERKPSVFVQEKWKERSVQVLADTRDLRVVHCAVVVQAQWEYEVASLSLVGRPLVLVLVLLVLMFRLPEHF